MAIADTITSMQTHTSNAYTMIGYGTDLTGINKNLENLSTSIFNAFLEALRTPDTLFTNLPKKSGTGANITLNDTANAPMRIELGATELSQDGTPTPSSPQDIHTISGSNTIKVESKNQLTGTWEQGTFSYVDNANYTDANRIRTTKFAVQPSTEYTFSCNSPLGEIAWIFYQENGTTYIAGSSLNTTGTTATITTPNNAYYIRIRIGNGTYPKTYTTDYHQRLDDDSYISQEADINLGGTNLLNNWFRFADGTYYGVVLKNNNNGSFTISGTATATGNISCSITTSEIKTKGIKLPTGTYTQKTATRFQLVDASGTWKQNTWETFTTSEELYVNNMFISITSGTTYNNTYWYMLNEGSTAKDYVPYVEPIEYCKIGNYEDKFIRTSGKNLIPFTNQDFTKNNVRYYVQNGMLILNGSSTGETSSSSTEFKNNFAFNLKAGTYNFNWKFINGISVLIKKYDDNTTLAQLNQNTSNVSFTISNDTQVYIGFYVYQATANNTNIELALNKGTTALPYEPYGSNEWYIEKNIGKVVLDSNNVNSIITGFTTTYSHNGVFLDKNTLGWQTSWTQNVALMNKYKEINATANVENGTFASNFTQAYIAVFNDNFTDLETAKTDIIGTEIYIVKATPTYTQITGTLAEQLENVYKNLLSYSGTTNISQENDDLSFVLSVQAIEE